MKHARALARAASVSLALFALSSRAEAEPPIGQLYGVGSSVNPTTGPVTNNVAAFVDSNGRMLMRVRWQCGQPTPCEAAGQYLEYGWRQYWFMTQSADAPGPIFYLMTSPECVARYGANARAGAWLSEAGAPVVQQCFSTTRFLTIRPRPGWPPIRVGPITLPRQLRPPAEQLPPGTAPTP